MRHARPTGAIVSVGHHSPDATPRLARGEAWPIAIHRQATATDCLMISDTHSAFSLIAPHKWPALPSKGEKCEIA